MDKTPLYQVDAFTEKPFRGNPAAVCLMDHEATDEWLQNVAAELNLAETAFVWRRESSFHLRWFTPRVEVDLCGHATLAAAHVLYEHQGYPLDQAVEFASRSGTLHASCQDGSIWLDFPAQPPEPRETPAGLRQAVSATPLWTGFNGSDWLMRLKCAEEVHDVRVDFHALASETRRGLIVTAPSDQPEFDFISRFFAPAVGIDEDPVTGSAHCCLTPYWAEEFGKSQLTAWQASSRGGRLELELVGNRVKLGGRAVTVLQGELLV